MKSLGQIIGGILFVCFVIKLSFVWANAHQAEIAMRTHAAIPESIRDIQRKVGADPDGKFRSKTQKLYEEWYESQSGQYWCTKGGM